MNYDNNHTDKKLQELENQLLPDLSKMDEHWKQISLVLEPGSGTATAPKNFFKRRILLALAAVVIVTIVSLLVSGNLQPVDKRHSAETSLPVASRDTLPHKRSLTIPKPDSTHDVILLKARTTDGRDTVLKAIPAGKPAPGNQRLLLEGFYTRLQKKPEAFLINNKRDTTIRGKEGTQLYIPANSFDAKEDVTLLLTEVYSVNDMITQKLTTTSGGRQLVSGGMIYVDARDKKGDLIDLRDGASLRLDMRPPENGAAMELFYGIDYYRDDQTPVMDSINWQRTNQQFSTGNQPRAYAIIKNPVTFNRKDTMVWEDDSPRYTIKYPIGDTVAGKRDAYIKADSVINKRYGVDINRLGWINCDRFYNEPGPRTELIVDLGGNADYWNTFLVFEKYASIMSPSSKTDNTARFSNVKEGEPAKIIVIGVKKGKLVTAMQNVTISRTPVTNLHFEESSAATFTKNLVNK